MRAWCASKPAGSVNIRVESIAYYLGKHTDRFIADKLAANPAGFPLPISQTSQEKR